LALVTVDELVDLIDISLDEAIGIIEKAKRLLAQKQAREARADKEGESESAEAGEETELSASDSEETTGLASSSVDEDEPDPARTVASPIANYEEMSPSDLEIQETAAGADLSTSEAEGPMPIEGLQALAPGAQVIPESHSEWAKHAEAEETESTESSESIESEQQPHAEGAVDERGEKERAPEDKNDDKE
jgi:hypothetical protein